MIVRLLIALVAMYLLSGCAEHDGSSYRSARGLRNYWGLFWFGSFGVLFPDLVADRSGVLDRGVARLLCSAMLFAGSVVLADHYFDLDLDKRVVLFFFPK